MLHLLERKIVYILTPLAPYSKRSSFVNEIISNKNVGELY